MFSVAKSGEVIQKRNTEETKNIFFMQKKIRNRNGYPRDTPIIRLILESFVTKKQKNTDRMILPKKYFLENWTENKQNNS